MKLEKTSSSLRMGSLAGVAALVGLDVALRIWVGGHLVMNRAYAILGQSQIALTHYYNHGAVLGFWSHPDDEVAKKALSGVALLVLPAWGFLRRKHAGIWERASYLLVCASVLVNALDELGDGAVIDTFQLRSGTGVAIPFNLADCYIIVGCLIIGWQVLALNDIAMFLNQRVPGDLSD